MNAPWFSLVIPEAELRGLTREQYRQVTSWLRHCRRMIRLYIGART